MTAVRRVVDHSAPLAEFTQLQIKVKLRNTPTLVDNGSGQRARQRVFQPSSLTVFLHGGRETGHLFVSGPAYRKDGTLGVAQGYASYGGHGEDKEAPSWLTAWLDDSGVLGVVGLATLITNAPIEGDQS